MSSNRVEEIKKEDKKAFKSFAIMMVISAMGGAIIGGGSIYLQENIGDKYIGISFKCTYDNYTLCKFSIIYTSNNSECCCL